MTSQIDATLEPNSLGQVEIADLRQQLQTAKDELSELQAHVVPVLESRLLTESDDGNTLDCAENVILTIPNNWGQKGCAIRPAGTQVACAGVVTTNGTNATKTLTARLGAINPTSDSTDYDLIGVE